MRLDESRSDLDDKEDDEVQIIGGLQQEQVIVPSVKSAEDTWNNMAIKAEAIKEEKLKKRW